MGTSSDKHVELRLTGFGNGRFRIEPVAESACAISAQVYACERHASLAETARERLARLGYDDRVEIRIGDGSLGAPEGAPWRGILVAAAAPHVPDPLREQLDPEGGRLVVPVGNRERQDLIVVARTGDSWTETNDGPVVFVPLIGEEGFQS